MQTVKQALLFKHFSYEIEICPMGQKRLTITVTDSSNKAQYFEKELTLENIGTSTLIKAFEKAKKELSFDITTKKGGENQMVVIKVQVQSQFLRPVEEIIYINKFRDVSQAEALKKSIDYLNKRMKDLRSSDELQKTSKVLMSCEMKERHFSAGGTFEAFSEINLPKGKYVITWTFLAKATNQLMYIYLNQGQTPLLTNCAIYVPNQNNFIPFTYRKVHTVSGDNQSMNLQTYCTNSYPVTIRNCIVTAKRID